MSASAVTKLEVRSAELTTRESLRLDSISRLIPTHRRTMLDVGARDGRVTSRVARHFERVTALDLDTPNFYVPGVLCVKGDATRLDFPDDHFDVVMCSEVIEHIPDLERACSELRRVARHEVLIGVPYRQDLRVGRVTCRKCGLAQNSYGHLHSFDEHKLERLFGLPVIGMDLVGQRRRRSTDLGRMLMDVAGNPWGSYSQQEPCMGCGGHLSRNESRTAWQRGLSKLALLMENAATALSAPRAGWIHILFSKSV